MALFDPQLFNQLGPLGSVAENPFAAPGAPTNLSIPDYLVDDFTQGGSQRTAMPVADMLNTTALPMQLTTAPAFDPTAYSDQLNKTQLKRLQKFADIIGGGETLTKTQEAKLGKFSGLSGQDLASALNYTPTTQRYETKFEQFTPTGIASLTPETAPPVSPAAPSAFTPTYGDLYEYLTPEQEKKLERLSDRYAMGLLEDRQGKLNRLNRLLEKGQLGDIESWFSQEAPTYTAPTDLDFALPEGKTYEDIAKIFGPSGDPMLAFVAAEQLNLKPEDIFSLTRGFQPSYYNPIQTIEDIESTLLSGKSDAFDFGLATEYIKNPQDQRFIDNPALAQRAEQIIYAYQNPIKEPIENKITTPKGKEIAGSGQYGYVNNAPVLNARVLEKMFSYANKDQIGATAFNSNPELMSQLGWNPKSGEELNMIQKGVRILGIDERNYNPNALKELDAQIEAGGYTDSEGNFVPVTIPPELKKAAEKVGLNSKDYTKASDLYKDIEKATEGLYQVVGQYRKQWDPEEISQIADKGNHAAVMYREVNGMLVPVTTPNLFRYEKTKDPLIGGFVGDVLGSVPFLPEVVGFATGNPAIYAAMKGAQTAARSGDIGDVALSAGIAYLAPKAFDFVSEGVASLIPEGTSALVSDFVTSAATNAVMSAGIGALTGQDIDLGEIITDSILSSGINVGAGQVVKGLDMPKEYRQIAARIISDALRGKELDKIIQSAAIRGAFAALKNKDTGEVGGGG